MRKPTICIGENMVKWSNEISALLTTRPQGPPKVEKLLTVSENYILYFKPSSETYINRVVLHIFVTSKISFSQQGRRCLKTRCL